MTMKAIRNRPDILKWLEVGIKQFGRDAIEEMIRPPTGDAGPKPVLRAVDTPVRPVRRLTGRGIPVQREMPFMALLNDDEPPIPRELARRLRKAIVEHPGLMARERAVLLALLRRCRSGLHCWPGIACIAKDTGLSASTVSRALAGLRRKGVVVRFSRGRQGSFRGGRTSNHYRLSTGFIFGVCDDQPMFESTKPYGTNRDNPAPVGTTVSGDADHRTGTTSKSTSTSKASRVEDLSIALHSQSRAREQTSGVNVNGGLAWRRLRRLQRWRKRFGNQF